ncbi:M23 family metallopeptidase [Oscillatoria salina]|uniref:M23 family metallopeptidase n=1 Tax=Oscillatoria salina TaxID=331517 RepID=UPI0013B9D142|nr:M23 family metallopeptidase [Oscillatoria salina]MBZ8183033.1 M23 family metallopeptidase [Oscillatoria salina IIICB1]NET86606.1 M23 family metallopeptidase [Kamptonema sp. SIO1D9]
MKRSQILKLLALLTVAFSFPTLIKHLVPSLPAAVAQDSTQNQASTQYIWPAQGTFAYGYRSDHPGIDIAGPMGMTVMAAADGEVVTSGWDDFGLGNEIRIKHSDGSLTVYGHNQTLLVKKGDFVRQGQAIAYMGSTGNSIAPHVHFELHRNGNLINPLPFLPPLVAGKIPSPQIVTSQPVAPRVAATNSISSAAKCAGEAIIAGETDNFRVSVCQQNDQLVYIGQSKQNPTVFVRLPAYSLGGGQYRADNGSYSYYVSPGRVEVMRNGRQIRTEVLY